MKAPGLRMPEVQRKPRADCLFSVLKFTWAKSVRDPRKDPVEPRPGAKQPAGRHKAAHVFRRRFLRHERLVEALKRVRTLRTDPNLRPASMNQKPQVQ